MKPYSEEEGHLRFLKNKEGFTLIELLVVIGILAVLTSVTIVALNPVRQFRQARNTQRIVHTGVLLDAISQRIADHSGVWTCSEGPLPTTPTNMAATGGYDMATCLVPLYIAQMPIDPTNGVWVSTSSYSTGYSVQETASGRVTVGAPSTEVVDLISVTR